MNKNFQETASLSIVLSLFIHKISSKHDCDYNIQVTTSRSCEAVNGFHNATFGPGGKAIISCSVFRQYSWFQPLKAFSAFRSFSPSLSAIFLSGRGDLKENYVMFFTKFDWSVISSKRSKYGTFENE